MSQPVSQTVQMRDFGGIVLDADPLDIQAGSARWQTNLTCYSGQLDVRKGLALVSFESVTEAES